MVRRETCEEQTTSRPDDVWPDMWKFVSDSAKNKAKQRWAIEKSKLENARRLRGMFFIEPDDEEFKLTMKAAPGKLEVPMPAAMPGRRQHHKHKETCGKLGQHNTKYACIVEADESMRIYFALLMDICHLKNSELEPQYLKYKGRVALRGDI